MSKPGRPRALADEQKRRQLFALISTGSGVESAARHVGCSPWTVNREAQRDEEFAQQLRDAQTAAELSPLQSMRNATRDNWRAAAWWLERCYPERFARRKPETVSTDQVSKLLIDVATAFTEICDDAALQQQFADQLAQLQQRLLGTEQAATLGPPKPKSIVDIMADEAQQRMDDAMESLSKEDREFALAHRKPRYTNLP